MRLGVNVPNFGPGTDPGVLREWARIVEGLGFDLLMMSDHVTVTADVAQRYPEPFYEPFTARGRLTDEYLATLRDAVSIPIWVGGNSEAAIRRAMRFGDAWHPLHPTVSWLRTTLAKHSPPAFAPRIALRLTTTPVDDPERLAGVGTIEQVLDDLDQLRRLGADTVLLDPYNGDPEETRRPHEAWQALTAVATHRRTS